MRVFKLTTTDPGLFQAAWEGKIVAVPCHLRVAPSDIVLLGQEASQREVQGHVQPVRTEQGKSVLALVPVFNWDLPWRTQAI
jgi:hypothetical protein